MNTKRRFPTIILLSLGVIGLIGVVFSLASNKARPQLPPPQEIPPGWTNYRDEKYRFEFYYPQKYFTKGPSSTQNYLVRLSNNNLFEENWESLLVDVYLGDTNIFEANSLPHKKLEGRTRNLDVLYDELDLGLLKRYWGEGVRAEFWGDPPWGYSQVYIPSPEANQPGISFYIRRAQSDDPGYGGSYEDKETVKKILSTFRFLN